MKEATGSKLFQSLPTTMKEATGSKQLQQQGGIHPRLRACEKGPNSHSLSVSESQFPTTMKEATGSKLFQSLPTTMKETTSWKLLQQGSMSQLFEGELEENEEPFQEYPWLSNELPSERDDDEEGLPHEEGGSSDDDTFDRTASPSDAADATPLGGRHESIRLREEGQDADPSGGCPSAEGGGGRGKRDWRKLRHALNFLTTVASSVVEVLDLKSWATPPEERTEEQKREMYSALKSRGCFRNLGLGRR